MGTGFQKHLAAKESCAGDGGKAEGLDPAARSTGANPFPGILAESGIGDLVWCVLQGHCCPHPIWQRGYTALALFLMLE